MAETKLTLFKEKSETRVYDLVASISETGGLCLSEWYYYPSDGREYEYYITIPADEIIKLGKYLSPLSPTPETKSKEKQFLLRLKRFFEKKGFTNLRYDVRDWLRSENFKHDYSTWHSL